MTPVEINDRATTIANLAALASKIEHGAERQLIMRVALTLADNLDPPRYLIDKSTGSVIPFTGGKA